jgi:hypothetical protein
MNKEPTIRYLPKFISIDDLKETPREPVIPYFTKNQWHDFISRQRVRKRSALPLNQFQVRYQLAPWGLGDIIIYPNPEFDSFVHHLECKPVIKVSNMQFDPLKLRLIHVGFECHLKYCTPYIEVYVGRIPEGANGIGCDDKHCQGGCKEIFVGTQTDGYFTCTCRS